MTRRVVVMIPHRAPSWNQLWSNGNYWKRKKFKDKWRDITLLALGRYRKFKRPVGITVIASSVRPLDADNVCIKPILDALIGKLIEDDGYKWVHWVKLMPVKIKSDESVMLILEEV